MAVMACGFNVAGSTDPSTDPTTQQCPQVPQPTQQTLFGFASDRSAVPPPPISGGTLEAFPQGRGALVVASVPDASRIETFTLARDANSHLVASRVQEIELEDRADPGRIAQDASGRIHVVLRGRGSILTFEPTSATVVATRPVCPAPRGIAYDAKSDVLHVACATGELVTLAASGGPPIRSVHVDRDLRDVVVLGDKLLVSRFRAAEILTLDSNASILSRTTLPARDGRQPHVAWRMTEKHGKVAVAYQLESELPIDIRLATAVQTASPYGASIQSSNPSTSDGRPLVIAAVAWTFDGIGFGDAGVDGTAMPLFDVAIESNGALDWATNDLQSLTVRSFQQQQQQQNPSPQLARQIPAIASTVIDNYATILTQTSSPSAIHVYQRNYGTLEEIAKVTLPSASDVGFDAFHTPTPAGIACASCHPEGGDDGHTWHFVTRDLGRDNQPKACFTSGNPAPPNSRRTQSLRGGILATVPLHWDGDMGGMGDILSEVFTHRMGGGVVTPTQRPIVERWIDSIPRLPQRTDLDPGRVASGKALFEGKGGCSGCHSGVMFTDNQTVDIGKGAVQVPNLLGIGDRAPHMHDGCAKTLANRFDPSCGGSNHGGVLAPDEQALVIDYLESL